MNGLLNGSRGQHYLGAALFSLASMLASCTAAAISCVSPGDAPTLANQNQKTCLGAARFHALWRKDDGSLAAWGYNQSGQIGDGTYLDRSFPVGVASLSNVKTAVGGQFHSLALKTDGTVWAWGLNSNGQLGDGTGSDHALPVRVPALSAVVSLASGDYHALAVRNDSTVWAWGFNGDGQLGDNTTTERLAPVKVPGLTGIQAVAAGRYHSLALHVDGTVWAWGYNGDGQLGDGTFTSHMQPARVSGLTRIVAISTTYDHNMALDADGAVWTWGRNEQGQLGDNTATARAVPIKVTAVSNIAQISAGGYSSYARRSDGVVFSWGWNGDGQLGDGTFTARVAPVQVSGVGGAVSIAGGASHATILKSDGSIWSMGQNVVGQLGNAGTVQASAPIQLSALASVSMVSAGFRHTLALRTDGTVAGLGENEFGQLGDGTSISRAVPTTVPGLTSVVAVAAGYEHSLARRADKTVWAWGDNQYGQLGDATFTQRESPVKVAMPCPVNAIAAGYWHSLAVCDDGSVWAWGSNEFGQIGDGTSTDKNVPTRVTGLGSPAAIAAGSVHSLALRTDGSVAAWGRNFNGQLGNGTNSDAAVPVTVSGLTGVSAIAAGRFHTLALKSNGTVFAWGSNNRGKLGTGNYSPSNVPVQAVGVTGASAIAAGAFGSFAVQASGTVLAWGAGGLNGDGTDRDVIVPTALPFIETVERVIAGYDHAFAKTTAGSFMGWGSNYSAKLGIPLSLFSETAVKTRDPLVPFANSDLVVEFFNASLRNINNVQGGGHHFFTSYPDEQISVDNGGSGPGWVRTGRTFRAWNSQALAPAGAAPVYRFYTRTSNSHFYTASFAEYQSLRNQNPGNDATLGWAFESIAFYTVLPVDIDHCAAGYFPIYRAYNKRFAELDSNHRITPSYIDYVRSVYFLGYADEHVAFCSPAMSEASSDLHAWYAYPGAEVEAGGLVEALFIFSNNGPGSGNGGRVHISLPPEVLDWQYLCVPSPGTDCPSVFTLDALRSGQAIDHWPAGGVIIAYFTGTAPAGGMTMKFAGATTAGNGVPDGNRANNTPLTARTLVKSAQVCNAAVSPTTISLGPALPQVPAYAVQVNVLNGSQCPWSVDVSGVPWLSANPSSGTGNGVVTLTPQPNPTGTPRSGTLTIAGQQVPVTQSGVPCTFSASPPSVTLSAAAQQAQVNVTGVAGCQWTPKSTAASWLTVVSPANGSGSGLLTLSVPQNTSSASRTGAITIGDLSIQVAQAGTVEVAAAPPPPPPACSTLTLQRDGDQIAAAGLSGEGAVAILADAVCPWTSQSSVPWVNVTAGGSGKGNGTIKYVVQPNTDTQLRVGTITTTGSNAQAKSFTVTQQGTAVVVTDPRNDSGGDSSGGGGGGGGDGGGSSGGDSG